jgi:hypothetical protein
LASFEGGDLFLRRPSQVFLGLVDLAFALQELAIALLEHLRPLIELLIALDQATFLAGQLGPPGTRLLFGFTRQA